MCTISGGPVSLHILQQRSCTGPLRLAAGLHAHVAPEHVEVIFQIDFLCGGFEASSAAACSYSSLHADAMPMTVSVHILVDGALMFPPCAVSSSPAGVPTVGTSAFLQAHGPLCIGLSCHGLGPQASWACRIKQLPS